MYSDIVIPVDLDPEHTADAAVNIARTLASEDARLTLLHVIEVTPGYVATYLPEDHAVKIHARVEAELQAIADRLGGLQFAIAAGHAGRKIVDWSEEHGADLIVIASHRPSLGEHLIGTTASRVVRHAGCAVHVLR